MWKKLVDWYKGAQTGAEYFIRAVLTLIVLFGVLALLAGLVGCGKATPEDRVAAQMKTQHPLSADERAAAEINAKQYFEKQWAPAGGTRGQFNSCRPSDSNANGLVSCFGFVPNSGGGFAEKKMYCGYRPELVGCSDEDTVK